MFHKGTNPFSNNSPCTKHTIGGQVPDPSHPPITVLHRLSQICRSPPFPSHQQKENHIAVLRGFSIRILHIKRNSNLTQQCHVIRHSPNHPVQVSYCAIRQARYPPKSPEKKDKEAVVFQPAQAGCFTSNESLPTGSDGGALVMLRGRIVSSRSQSSSVS